ncbi:hypothetical protein MC885_003644 [Smutsia gigantea]|nr:hypothetical protein MC885_003644 [Smutsia gigantea]
MREDPRVPSGEGEQDINAVIVVSFTQRHRHFCHRALLRKGRRVVTPEGHQRRLLLTRLEGPALRILTPGRCDIATMLIMRALGLHVENTESQALGLQPELRGQLAPFAPGKLHMLTPKVPSYRLRQQSLDGSDDREGRVLPLPLRSHLIRERAAVRLLVYLMKIRFGMAVIKTSWLSLAVALRGGNRSEASRINCKIVKFFEVCPNLLHGYLFH